MQSRIGRRLFAAFFVLVAVPVAVAVLVGVRVGVAVAIGSGVFVVVAVGVALAVLVAVAVAVLVAVPVAVGVNVGVAVAEGVTVGVVACVTVKAPSTVVTGKDCAAGLARMAWVKGSVVLPLAFAASVYESVRIAPLPGAMVRLLKL